MPNKTPLLNRSDTLLGVCEGLGRDLGIQPNILRIAFGVGLMWNPVFVVATYLALGVAVYAARFFFPEYATPATSDAVTLSVEPAHNDDASTTDRLAA